jgi:hypothetical protein
MISMIPVAKRLVIGAVAVGTLSLGTAGIAGAATSSAATPAVPSKISQFNCARATKVLTRIEKGEGRITAGLPRLTAAEAKATKAGHAKRADRLKKRIARLEGSKFKTRLTAASAAIEAKCHVPAPSPTSTTPAPSTSSTTQA